MSSVRIDLKSFSFRGSYFFLFVFIVAIACSNGERSRVPIGGVSPDTTTTKVEFINIFIENSGSMNGFVSGNTEFKDALGKVLVRLNKAYGKERVAIYFVNSKIHTSGISADVDDFNAKLNVGAMRVGDVSSSEINSIFRQVLERTTPDTVSILISDLIYSIKGDDTAGLLSEQRNSTLNAFNETRKRMDLGIHMTQMSSTFTGQYWDKNETSTYLRGEQRPYYFLILGNPKLVVDIHKHIALDQEAESGYRNQFAFGDFGASGSLKYGLLGVVGDKYRVQMQNSEQNEYGGIVGARATEGRGDGPTKLIIGLNTDELVFGGGYITRPDAFEISGSSYVIEGFTSPEEASSMYSVSLSGNNFDPDLVLIARTDGFPTTFRAFVNPNVPAWVDSTNTLDDTNPDSLEGRTFGFHYVVDGISKAFLEEKKSSASNIINIEIEESSGMKFMIYALMIVVIIWFVNFLKNKVFA